MAAALSSPGAGGGPGAISARRGERGQPLVSARLTQGCTAVSGETVQSEHMGRRAPGGGVSVGKKVHQGGGVSNVLKAAGRSGRWGYEGHSSAQGGDTEPAAG